MYFNFHQKLCLCFPCLISFEKYVYVTNLTHFSETFDEKLSRDIEFKKKLFQDHAISKDKFNKICVIVF